LVDSADTLLLTARAGNGEIDVDGVSQQGHDLRVTRNQPGLPAVGSTTPTTGAAPGTIVLHVKAGVGQVEVLHATS
jgi:hypothetical protein